MSENGEKSERNVEEEAVQKKLDAIYERCSVTASTVILSMIRQLQSGGLLEPRLGLGTIGIVLGRYMASIVHPRLSAAEMEGVLDTLWSESLRGMVLEQVIETRAAEASFVAMAERVERAEADRSECPHCHRSPCAWHAACAAAKAEAEGSK